MSHHPTLHCRNCQHDLQALRDANFCPQCGQETVLHPPTLWEFVHEFITHYIALEGALWRSLCALLLQPGKLTREYFYGRRKHYVLPLRLYLSASFVFFLVVKIASGGHDAPTTPAHAQKVVVEAEAVADANAETEAKAEAVAPSASAASSPEAKPRSARSQARSQARRAWIATHTACFDTPGSCNWLDTTVGEFIAKSQKGQVDQIDWQPRIVGAAPYAIFLMLPLFAALLQLAYWRRRMPYGEHFVFSLHLHSFWFVAMLLIEVLPDSLVILPLLAIPVYGCWAMHHVYGGRWWPTLTRAGLLSFVYGVLLALGAAALAVWVILNS